MHYFEGDVRLLFEHTLKTKGVIALSTPEFSSPLILINLLWRGRSDRVNNLLATIGYSPVAANNFEYDFYLPSQLVESLLGLSNPLDICSLYAYKAGKGYVAAKNLGGIYTPIITVARRSGAPIEFELFAQTLKESLGSAIGHPQIVREFGIDFVSITCYEAVRDNKGRTQGCVGGIKN